MSIALLIIGCLYTLLILLLYFGNIKLKKFQDALRNDQTSQIPTIKFSIVIPFRNEQHRILPLLQSINKLKFPKSSFEIIFIDDASSDDSIFVINTSIDPTIDYQILTNKNVSKSPKKDAITLAVSKAKNEWIITTDADCIVPQYWLETYAQFIDKKHPSLICGPIAYSSNNSFLNKFQQLDALSLQWVGMGSFGYSKPIMANGANMAYRVTLFESLNGFEGNTNIASGDDIFMLEKAKKSNINGVKFLRVKNAIVFTQPEKNWKSVINQRVRWASKTSKVKNQFSQGIGLLVFLANAAIIIGVLWSVFNLSILWHVLIYFILKLILDAIALYQSASFFGIRLGFISVVKSAIIYPFTTMIVVVGSIKGRYNWKGRDF
ncbi:glycosyl transferase [Patiriisocius marinistellae]|uniref:Glycosyl transferase n=1 Tax=Patiriisocius marinistellae TaxID=2494560 RepID=A0A5J4FSW2_9FLAO|nr:glycosyltransferase [Patiriisocius marinistellae]GEQ84520.1 glycosyl transferase [Patiriisocius marinistellae]